MATQVREPNKSDWNKCIWCLQFLKNTKDDYLTLAVTHPHVIKCYVDESFAVHSNFKSHLGWTNDNGSWFGTTNESKAKVEYTELQGCRVSGRSWQTSNDLVIGAIHGQLRTQYWRTSYTSTTRAPFCWKRMNAGVRVSKTVRLKIRYFFSPIKLKKVMPRCPAVWPIKW